MNTFFSAEVQEHFTSLREDVLETFAQGYPNSFTADEIAAELSKSVLAIRPRVTELFKAEKIRKTGEKRMNTSGMSANVWQWIS